MKLVRLKPFNGKSHKLRTYTVFGIKFDHAKGWYKVDDDVAEYLATVKQIQDGQDAEYSAAAFDIVDSLDEAKALEEREKKKALRASPENAQKTHRVHAVAPRAGAAVPSKTMTTKDLPENFDDLDGTFPDGDMAPPRAKAPADALDGADEVDGDDLADSALDETDEAPADDGLLPQPNKSKAKGKGKK